MREHRCNQQAEQGKNMQLSLPIQNSIHKATAATQEETLQMEKQQ
jgi:hypothetical protein